MSIDLTQPLAWTQADPDATQMLDDLQGNILKGHGRDFTAHLFLHFDKDEPRTARLFLNARAATLTSAHQQLQDAAAYRHTGASAGAFSALLLTAEGYRALGLEDRKPTVNAEAFEAGMRAHADLLKDPPVDTWDQTYGSDRAVHAMLLLAEESEVLLEATELALDNHILATRGAVSVLGREHGRALRNADKNGIEHFGYVDGRSQPLMLVEDIEKEKPAGGFTGWDPSIPLGQVLVPDPGGSLPNSHGSYFVFRKLEQNVRGFKKDERRLAQALSFTGPNEELAGAMVVGRFENGEATALKPEAGNMAHRDVPNDFNYSADPDGLKCPFAGHIRKTNPRGESEVKLPQFVQPGTEKAHLMARRGITYGRREQHPNKQGLRFEDMPTGDVGLLFMAYQSNLATQFEFTQRTWANNPDFVGPGAGIDPVIGHATQAPGQKWPTGWGEALAPQTFDFSGWVTMMGGDYFFAPSLSMLRNC